MAEGIAKHLFGNSVSVESAGSQPRKLNPLAIKAMQEIGIDISRHYSKSYDDLTPKFIVSLDYVITLCAEEVCPTMVSKAKKLHWPIPDPAKAVGTEDEKLQYFRDARDATYKKIEEFRKQATR